MATPWVEEKNPHIAGISESTYRKLLDAMSKTIRSKAMLKAAEGQCCTNCGKNDGTTVAAHYQGIRGDSFGRGGSEKGHDLLVADLCSECHDDFDNYRGSFVVDKFQRKVDLSERFLYCVAITLIRRFRQGILQLTKPR
jgi:hypothetical protein